MHANKNHGHEGRELQYPWELLPVQKFRETGACKSLNTPHRLTCARVRAPMDTGVRGEASELPMQKASFSWLLLAATRTSGGGSTHTERSCALLTHHSQLRQEQFSPSSALSFPPP